MPLCGYASRCEERQAIIVSKDYGTKREHRAINVNRSNVSQYKIDGDVVRDQTIRCDFLVMNEDKRDAYLIELKGSDIEHAINQLETTAARFKSELRAYKIKYRIVCSYARTQALKSNTYKKFLHQHPSPDEFLCRTEKLEENI